MSVSGGGGGSIPKPLTYDYMPEGYPSKSVVTVTLMEEQEVTFADMNGVYGAGPLVVSDIKPGDKLTVVWDGVSYDAVVKNRPKVMKNLYMFGNLALIGIGEAADYPFAYMGGDWATADTSPSHTIKVMRQQETITPMSTEFIPKNLNVVFNRRSSSSSSSIPDSCNVTYDELRGRIENGVPVFAVYKLIDDHGSVGVLMNIMQFVLNTDSLMVYYQNRGSTDFFKYKPDGTFSGSGGEEI